MSIEMYCYCPQCQCPGRVPTVLIRVLSNVWYLGEEGSAEQIEISPSLTDRRTQGQHSHLSLLARPRRNSVFFSKYFAQLFRTLLNIILYWRTLLSTDLNILFYLLQTYSFCEQNEGWSVVVVCSLFAWYFLRTMTKYVGLWILFKFEKLNFEIFSGIWVFLQI